MIVTLFLARTVLVLSPILYATVTVTSSEVELLKKSPQIIGTDKEVAVERIVRGLLLVLPLIEPTIPLGPEMPFPIQGAEKV